MTDEACTRAIALSAPGRGPSTSGRLTSHRFPLDDAAKTFEIASRRKGLKVVVDLSAP
jgi:hypothetical protein